MKRQAYIKPQVRALMIQHSGDFCASMTNVSGEGFDYGGPGEDEEPRARQMFDFFEEDDFATNDTTSLNINFDIENILK